MTNLNPNQKLLAAAVEFAITMCNEFEKNLVTTGDDPPWHLVPPCPVCDQYIDRESLLIPLVGYMDKIHGATAHLVSNRMRPILRGMLGHMEVCKSEKAVR